jgi:NifU-like protein involved in Fe-S cluster formation
MATALYTPAVLALATGLSQYRLDDSLTLRSEARSRSCGSSLMLGLMLDDRGYVTGVGLRSQACAIGQASAAIFAQSAIGRSDLEIDATATAIQQWLAGEGGLPVWPALETIAAARDYPSRHGALMLPWTAARQLLSTRAAAG